MDRSRRREALLASAAELRRRLAVHDAEVDGLRRQLGSEVTDDEHDPEGTTLSAGWALLEGLRRDEPTPWSRSTPRSSG